MPEDQANPELPKPGADSPTTTPQPGGAADTTFDIDGQKLSTEDIRAALKAKTDYERLTPEFTRRSQLLSNPDQLLEYARKTYPDRFPSAPKAPESPDEQALAEAEKVLRGRGFTTKEEVAQLFQEQLAQREADAALKTERTTLEGQFDGQDGKPKFNYEEVLRFAAEGGYPNLTSAFKILKEAELQQYFATHTKVPKAPVVARPGSTSVPVGSDNKKVRLDDGSFEEAFDEMVGGQD